MKNLNLISILCISLTACTSLDLKYQADLQTEKGPAHYNFEKSYSMHHQAIACLTTFYLAGGGCWVYLLRPLNSDKEKLMIDVKSDLEQRIGEHKYDTKTDEIERNGWGFSSQKSSLNYGK